MTFRLAMRSALMLCVAAAVMTGQTVRAEFLGPTITVTASNERGTASMDWTVPNLPDQASERARFALGEREELRNENGELVATVDSLGVFLDGDPVVDLDFSVTAGTTNTTFTITSAVNSFAALVNPIAFATAAVTVTDGATLPGNGASIAPSANPNLYQARYNGANVFADLLGSVTRTGAGSATMSADTGISSIAGSVTDISAELSFVVSANDLASGTSHYEIAAVPEPATAGMILCGLLGLFAARRRS